MNHCMKRKQYMKNEFFADFRFKHIKYSKTNGLIKFDDFKQSKNEENIR